MDSLINQTEKLSGIKIRCPKCGGDNVSINRYSIQSDLRNYAVYSQNPVIHTIEFEYKCFNCFTFVTVKTEMECEKGED